MKRHGILNSDISRVLSYMGHTDCICIGDCGLPIPDETERIDLASWQRYENRKNSFSRRNKRT